MSVTPVAAKNDDGDQGKSSQNRNNTTTTVAATNSSGSSGNSGGSGGSSNSNNSGGSSNSGGNASSNAGGSGNSNNANKSENAKSNDKAESATKTDDKKDDVKDDNVEEVDDPETPRTYIVRFVSNVKAADAGKAMVDTYNDEVTKENNAARAAAQAEAAKSKTAKTPKGRSANDAATATAKVKLKARGTYKTAFTKVLNAAVIQVPPSAVAGLLRNPRVLSIERDSTVLVDPTSQTQVGATWGLDRLDQRSLPLSGTFTSPSTASNVFAYVVDTGIDATHPEFGGRVNSGFDAVNGGSGQNDCNGHGTHVAGTIGSQT